MRTRIFDEKVRTEYERDYYKSGSTYAFDRQIPYTAEKSFCAMNDVVTPNFKSLIAKGQIINNHLTYVNSQCFSKPAVVESSGICYGNVHSFRRVYPPENFSGVSLPFKGSFVAADEYVNLYDSYLAQSLQKAYSKIAINEAMALASLGELPETIKWMSSVIGRGVKAARYCLNKKSVLKDVSRIRKFVTSRSIFDVPGNTWMEMRYALRPLVFEAEQCLKAMQAIVNKELRQTARGVVRFNESLSQEVVVDSDFLFTLTHKTVNSHVFRGGVLFKVDEDINGILALWGLDQPIQSLYELTPLSFALDWFFNIGDVIGAWAPKAGLSNLTSWSSAQIFIRGSYELKSFRDKDPSRCSSSSGLTLKQNPQITYVTQIKKRIANPNLSILPSCRIKLDAAKIVDLCLIGKGLLKL